jgi:hypothetical protein
MVWVFAPKKYDFMRTASSVEPSEPFFEIFAMERLQVVCSSTSFIFNFPQLLGSIGESMKIHQTRKASISFV